ncbi:hypothetical protein LOD99_7826 [Oopsacas minuta]|uniref:DH domain-containing protein n=1 Tax=Oopsacas minuta TaxID=111878 RepID=A0AAV7JPD7_9METZ|nr:hypothetical protein LOD99_7826 [Oopsacas minuta]
MADTGVRDLFLDGSMFRITSKWLKKRCILVYNNAIGEKDTIFTDQVNESPNFPSPYSTPKQSKNRSPDRVMQSIVAIDTQLEAEERVLIGLESQLEIPLDPVVRDLKDTSANYCRYLDEALTLLDKFDEEHPIYGVLEYGLSQIRSHVQCWDLPSIRIKPMQRILKYPLLGDLVKYTEDDHSDKKHLICASKLMGEVANQINEVERRKDLGPQKQAWNMNWHSVIKKTRRVNQIILKSVGINTSVSLLFPVLLVELLLSLQTVDEVFQPEERRLKELEKTLKSVVKSITTLVTYMQVYIRLKYL